jgi:hypothetical protein
MRTLVLRALAGLGAQLVDGSLGATVLSGLSTETAEPVMSLILLGLGLYVMSRFTFLRTGWRGVA